MANSTSALSIRQLGGKLQFIRYVQDHAVLDEGSSSEFAVLVSILDRTNGDGNCCYAKVATIARGAYMSERSTIRAMKKLAGAGLIVCTGTKKHPSGQSTKVWDVVAPVAVHREGVTDCHAKGCQSDTSRGDRLADNPSHDPSPSGEAAHDAPSSHLADSDLSVATTRSAVQHEGHGEGEHEEQDELSSGTSGDAVPPVTVGASQEQAKEGAVDPRRLNGRALLAHRWGEDSAARAVHLSMQCAGGLMSEELFGLLADVDGEFADWCSDYGSRIASRAAWSEREAAGILASKLRTFDRGIWLAA